MTKHEQKNKNTQAGNFFIAVLNHFNSCISTWILNETFKFLYHILAIKDFFNWTPLNSHGSSLGNTCTDHAIGWQLEHFGWIQT